MELECCQGGTYTMKNLTDGLANFSRHPKTPPSRIPMLRHVPDSQLRTHPSWRPSRNLRALRRGSTLLHLHDLQRTGLPRLLDKTISPVTEMTWMSGTVPPGNVPTCAGNVLLWSNFSIVQKDTMVVEIQNVSMASEQDAWETRC